MFKYKSLLAAATLVALIMVGCNENTTTPTPTPPNPISSLMATSVNETTVRVKWTAPTTGTFTSYILRVIGNASDTTKFTASSTTNIFEVGSLKEGVAYTFSVTTLNSDNLESTAKSMKWAGARRFTKIGSAEIYLYEHASIKGSGLRLYDPTTKSPAVLDISGGQLWDIAIDSSDATSETVIGSPSPDLMTFKINNRRLTAVGDIYNNIDSLEQIYVSSDLSVKDPTTNLESEGVYNLPNSSAKGYAMVVKTQDGNFAKIFVKSVGGKILQGTAPNRYVEVEISYQTAAGVPHAEKNNDGQR